MKKKRKKKKRYPSRPEVVVGKVEEDLTRYAFGITTPVSTTRAMAFGEGHQLSGAEEEESEREKRESFEKTKN
jgi:hypothetical protein